jgi:hypothetical protein
MKRRQLESKSQRHELGVVLLLLLSERPATCFAWHSHRPNEHFRAQKRTLQPSNHAFSPLGSCRAVLYSDRLNGDSGIDNDEDQHHESLQRVESLFSKIRFGNKNGFPSVAVANGDTETVVRLQRENELLREKLKVLEEENQMLHANRIVLETFEGEGKIRKYAELQQQHLHDAEVRADPSLSSSTAEVNGLASSKQQQLLAPTDLSIWCDQLDDDESCPIEPMVSFGEALRDRSFWLVGLLILQSCSGMILASNEALLANHPVSKFCFSLVVVGQYCSVQRGQVAPFAGYLSNDDSIPILSSSLVVFSHLLSYHAGGRRWQRR